VVKIEGNSTHLHNQGRLCPKGLAITQFMYHPDRVTHPLKRVGERDEGKWGIRINENITKGAERIRIDYIPFPTEFCDLCAARTKEGEQPACVKHCQGVCMTCGPLDELAKTMEEQPRSVLFAPRASYQMPPSI